MAATPSASPAIRVYASFPRVVAFGAALNLNPDNWHWVLCLSFPLETLNVLKFSLRPYKWIRYATGIVVGAQGDLSSSSDSPNVVDYDAGLPDESADLYYCTSEDEKRRMFPVDPNIARTNDTSTATTRRAQFLSEVAERDGHECVLTGEEALVCDAVHLLAHRKGDEYISTYTRFRSRNFVNGDLVQDIDSIRNGLFLNAFTHRTLGKHVAFLPTPNFAMNTDDVDPTALPGEKRYTANLFEPSRPAYLGLNTPSGTPLRISDTDDWPPSILFDAVYAGVVLRYFGTQTLKDVLTATWMNTGGIVDQALGGHEAVANRRALAAQRRQERDDAPRVSDVFDMLLSLPYVLVPPENLRTIFKEREEEAEAEEKRRVQEEVDAWNRDVIAP